MRSSGYQSTKRLTSGAKASVTTSACMLLAIDVLNSVAAVTYVQLFDALVANVTLGTTVPVRTFAVLASGSLHIELPVPMRFFTGMVIGSTTTRTGATGAACEVEVVIEGTPAA